MPPLQDVSSQEGLLSQLSTLGTQLGLPHTTGQSQAAGRAPLQRWTWSGPQRQAAETQRSSASAEAKQALGNGIHHIGDENWQGAAGGLFLSLLTAQSSDRLQEAKVQLIDVQLCNSSDWYSGDIHPYNLCAGYPQGTIDTCQVGACHEPLSPQQHGQPGQHRPNTAQGLLCPATQSPSQPRLPTAVGASRTLPIHTCLPSAPLVPESPASVLGSPEVQVPNIHPLHIQEPCAQRTESPTLQDPKPLADGFLEAPAPEQSLALPGMQLWQGLWETRRQPQC